MGVVTGINAFARVIGPLLMGRVYTFYGTYATYGLALGVLVVALAVSCLSYKRLSPIRPIQQSDNTLNENETFENSITKL